MFLVFWFLHFSPMESWKLQLNLLRIGSKRFQIILMLVIFISNWTRSTICVFLQHPLKKRTTTFLVSLQRARTWKKTTKCKEYKYYSEIEMLLIHKRIVSLLKGERGIGGGNAFIGLDYIASNPDKLFIPLNILVKDNLTKLLQIVAPL